MSKTVKKNSAAERSAIREAKTEFHVARSEAITSYAQLEQNMAFLFAGLMGKISLRKAFIAFEAISSLRARLVMLEKLLTRDHGDTYQKFFTGFIRDVGGINNTRNNIVHWIIYTTSRGEEPFDPSRDIFLGEHPNLFGEETMLLHEINEFSRETEFYSLLLLYFRTFLKEPNLPGDPNKTSWHDIFQSKPVYPPPLGHPLDRFSEIP